MRFFLFFLLIVNISKFLFPYKIISDNPGVVVSVFDFCLDKKGNIYVPNYYANELIKFNKKGETVLRIPMNGWPWCVNVDEEENIYIGAQYKKGIYIFSQEGDRKKIIKTESINKIFIDSEANIYVFLRESKKIVKFAKEGKQIENFGIGGFLGPFSNFKDMVMDRENNIYVCDGNKIFKFKNNGEKIKEIEVESPLVLGVDKNNNIYIGFVSKFLKFNKELEKIEEIKSNISYPRCIRIDEEGNIYVSDMSKLMKFKPDLTPVNEFEEKNLIGGIGLKDGYFVLPTGIVMDKEGNIIICDLRSNRVQKLNTEGKFITKFYTKYEYNRCISLDKEGNIYIGNLAYNCIIKFNPDGSPVKIGEKYEFGGSGKDIGKFSQIIGIAIDEEGNIYVAEGTGRRIQKFTKNGEPKNDFSGKNFIEIDGNCGGLYVDEKGNIYITNATKHCIMKFKPDGFPANDFLSGGRITNIFGSYGNIPGRFNSPSGIFVDEKDGSIYVVDTGNARIQKFNKRGEFLGWFGRYGYKQGKIREPIGIFIDNTGYLYITDTGNSRIYKIKIEEIFN